MPRRPSHIIAAGLALLCLLLPARAQTPDAKAAATPAAQVRTLDDFEDIPSWKVITADGVSLKISGELGPNGQAARLNYDFSRGSGYAIIRKRFDLDLPVNYRFSFQMRGEGPRNTLEFKLVDPSGDNVWWLNQRDMEFPKDWSTFTVPRRKISFAWGPAGAQTPLRTAAFIEIVITSSSGGRGSVWLDELTFEPLPEVRPYTGTPTLTASSGATTPIKLAADGRFNWTSAPDDILPTIRIDFGQPREIGGVILDWGDDLPVAYEISASTDGELFVPAANVRASRGGRDYITAPDTTASILEIRTRESPPGRAIALSRLRFTPPDFADSLNEVVKAAAADDPRGWWPCYLTGQASYWTVVGADADEQEALINEDGAIEVRRLGFSLEPFIYENNTLTTWADGTSTQSLDSGDLPIPTVLRSHKNLDLKITAFVIGNAGESNLILRYELINTGDAPRQGKLFVAIRPVQVNPPYQNLNITGGAATIGYLGVQDTHIVVNTRAVYPLTPAEGFGATAFDGGEIINHLARGLLPVHNSTTDPRALASGALQYGFDLPPGGISVVALLVPFHNAIALPTEASSSAQVAALVDDALARTRTQWRERLRRVTIRLPKSQQRITDSIHANLAYILINRDGPALQPGSRCYERTWIRDGALTSSAMLAMGLTDEVREFLDWFAPFQYDNGKIPCCVDRRGPDPVPEHDSHGQYIHAVRTYFDFTGDSDFLARHWPRVRKATDYIEFLRNQRMSDEYAAGPDEKRILHGLMPESISHEGYSAKPMHSYWDDFWTLRGLSDAAHIAALAGDREQAARLAALANSFDTTLRASLALSGTLKKIDYLPGCAELGDFDATSSTVALFPCAFDPRELKPRLDATFDKYWTFFKDRRDGRIAWKDYTPYEHRVVGAMVLLGRRDRALVLGAGLPRVWAEDPDGVAVSNLRSEFGPITYSARPADGGIRMEIAAIDRPPASGVWIAPPDPAQIEYLTIAGAKRPFPADGHVRIDALPAVVEIRYRTPLSPAPAR